MQREQRLIFGRVIIGARFVERDRLIDAAAQRTLPPGVVVAQCERVRRRKLPVDAAEECICNWRSVQAADLCMLRVEPVTRAENRDESRQRVTRYPERELVRLRTNNT